MHLGPNISTWYKRIVPLACFEDVPASSATNLISARRKVLIIYLYFAFAWTLIAIV
jgi:hypothetical protein